VRRGLHASQFRAPASASRARARARRTRRFGRRRRARTPLTVGISSSRRAVRFRAAVARHRGTSRSSVLSGTRAASAPSGRLGLERAESPRNRANRR